MSKYGDKGAIYLCSKKETKKGFELQLVEKPEIKISGEDLEWCKVEICMQIMQWNGDGEAVLEIIPDLKKRHKTGIEMYRSLGYNEDVKLLNTNDLFTKGICPKCKYGIGERTDELLNMAEKPSIRYGIVSVRARTRRNEEDFPRVFPEIQIYRKRVVELLTQEEKNLFEEREVLCKGKESDFIELIPKNVIAQCGHKGAEYDKHRFLKTWRCTECGRTEMHFQIKELYTYQFKFVDPKTIPNYPTMFFLQWGIHTYLVVRNDRWMEMLQDKQAVKGIPTNPVVVLDDEHVEYPTSFYEPEKFEW